MSRHLDIAEAALEPLELAADDVLAGCPEASGLTWATIGSVEVGIWSLTAGTVRDIETDEVFIVVAGNATVCFETGEQVHLIPGRIVRLDAGERTQWTVHETLRKVYIS